MTDLERREWLKCSASAIYFIHQYCQIYDATARAWIPFHLWRAQRNSLNTILNNRLVVILKARQLGMTWLCLAFALWLVLFRPAATILVFSKDDISAMYLLGLERLKGMYEHLPAFLKCRRVVSDNYHEWKLSNGSVVRSFPTTQGDSYTATLAIVDEADLVPDLNKLMNAVKPTIDAGGRMILLSRTNKREPQSEFKRIYRAAKNNANGWASVFLAWDVRPERDAAWYESIKSDFVSRTNSVDGLYEQYPATDAQALAPATLDKRIPYEFLGKCYRETKPLSGKAIAEDAPKPPALPGLEVYALPQPGIAYVIGADPAEGNPTSDDSALTVLRSDTGEECAVLSGKFEPSTFGGYIDAIGKYYNNAAVLVERNNHGHAVLLWLRDNSHLRRLCGLDSKEGWNSTTKGNVLLYDGIADAFREEETILHSFETFTQLASIEGASLSAPGGEHDDRADSYALAIQAITTGNRHATAEFVA